MRFVLFVVHPVILLQLMLILSLRRTFSGFTKFGVRALTMSVDSLNQVPDVEIESDGVFKYILIRVYAKQNADGNEPSKMIVRGNKRGPYHADIYDEARAKIEKLGLDTECVGGGRINHESQEKKMLVYGYSQGFGKADHEVTVGILKKYYKDYNVTFTNEGY